MLGATKARFGAGAGGSWQQVAESRWRLVGEDGRHVWLGRDSDPTVNELDSLARQLDGQGTAAWLVVMRGDYWSAEQEPEVLVVRLLTRRNGDQESALARWRAARVRATGG